MWHRLIAPVLAAIALAIVVVLALTNFATLLGVEPTSPLRWGIPGAYLVIAILGVIWALVLQLRRPEVYATIVLAPRAPPPMPAVWTTSRTSPTSTGQRSARDPSGDSQRDGG